jgi:hypothetical protein
MRVLNVLPARFGKYGLTLHPQKTRVLGSTSVDRRGLVSRRAG